MPFHMFLRWYYEFHLLLAVYQPCFYSVPSMHLYNMLEVVHIGKVCSSILERFVVCKVVCCTSGWIFVSTNLDNLFKKSKECLQLYVTSNNDHFRFFNNNNNKWRAAVRYGSHCWQENGKCDLVLILWLWKQETTVRRGMRSSETEIGLGTTLKRP